VKLHQLKGGNGSVRNLKREMKEKRKKERTPLKTAKVHASTLLYPEDTSIREGKITSTQTVTSSHASFVSFSDAS